jgi:cytochrome c
VKRSLQLLLPLATIATSMLLMSCGDKPVASRQGDPGKGRIALTQYACQACHNIPGITGSEVFVGPPLDGVASRPMIAGRLPNNRDNLIRWIRDPQAIDPQTAMPNMGVSEQHANDMAAYLATLK